MSNNYNIPREKVLNLTELLNDYVSVWTTIREDLAYKLIKQDIESKKLKTTFYQISWFGLRWRKTQHDFYGLLRAWYLRDTDGRMSDYSCVSEKLSNICRRSDNDQWRKMAHFISGYNRKYLHTNTDSLYDIMTAWMVCSDSDHMVVDANQLRVFNMLYRDLPIAHQNAVSYRDDNVPLKRYQDLIDEFQLTDESE